MTILLWPGGTVNIAWRTWFILTDLSVFIFKNLEEGIENMLLNLQMVEAERGT